MPDARNGLTHLPAVLHAQRPTDLVIIQLGTNDLHEQYGLTIDQIADHLRALIDLVQSYDYKGFCVQDILINLPIHPSDESRMVISRGDLAERF